MTFGHLWLEMAPSKGQKPFHFLNTSDGKQILISPKALTTYEMPYGENSYFQVIRVIFPPVPSPLFQNLGGEPL